MYLIQHYSGCSVRVFVEEICIEITELWVKQIPTQISLRNVGGPNSLKTYLEEKVDLPWSKSPENFWTHI